VRLSCVMSCIRRHSIAPGGHDEHHRSAGSAGSVLRQGRLKSPLLSAGEVVLDALRAQVEHLRAEELGARQTIPSAVAEMRVTTRQLRSTLRGFSRVLDPEALSRWPRS